MYSDLILRLRLACVASCTCCTKTHEVKYHDAKCNYRLFSEAADALSCSDEWQTEGEPAAISVLATRFDDTCGEWAYSVITTPISYPFTHWRHLPKPPDWKPSP